MWIRRSLKRTKFLVTAGATIEKLDPIRYLSNFSSGKQGIAIANALVKSGAEVVLIAGKIDPTIKINPKVKLVYALNAKTMLDAAIAELPVDGAIFAAAVCDFRPEEIALDKIKKVTNQDKINLTLVKNPDILKTIATHKQRPSVVIGFAAETSNLLESAKAKLIEKNCDAIVANNIIIESNHEVFASDKNKISILTPSEAKHYPVMSKELVAKHIIKLIINLLKV